MAGLPLRIAEREVAVVLKRLDLRPDDVRAVELEHGFGPGNAVLIEVQSERVTEVFSGIGEKRLPAEAVAARAADEAAEYLASGAAVGRHLADQLLLYLALAGGGRFRTLSPSLHATTNADVIREFLPVEVAIEPGGDDAFDVEVRGAAGGG